MALTGGLQRQRKQNVGGWIYERRIAFGFEWYILEVALRKKNCIIHVDITKKNCLIQLMLYASVHGGSVLSFQNTCYLKKYQNFHIRSQRPHVNRFSVPKRIFYFNSRTGECLMEWRKLGFAIIFWIPFKLFMNENSHQNKNIRHTSWFNLILPKRFDIITISITQVYKSKKVAHHEDLEHGKVCGKIAVIHSGRKQGVDIACRHPYGWTALHVAAINGRANVVKWLLQNGIDPNETENFSNTYQVARDNRTAPINVEVIREAEFSTLLDNSQMFRGCTALHYAVLRHDQETVQLLLEFGADPTIGNEYHFKPEDYAKDTGMRAMMQKYSEKYKIRQKQAEIEERRKFPLEQRIKQRIIGQEGAIAIVSGAIRRKENGWYDEDHPLVFLFLGSSGIGKTELAKQVTEYLHKGKANGFIRMDMSEFQQKHEVAKFIGSPPGYVGHDDGGQLTKKLREFPKAVVLFDEVEKAHPDVLTIMLQLFDEGRLTDGKGKTIECKDAIFIMTSNLASDEIAEYGLQLREEAEKITKQRTEGEPEDLEITETITISRRWPAKYFLLLLRCILPRLLIHINRILYFLMWMHALLTLLAVGLKALVDHFEYPGKGEHTTGMVWANVVVVVLAGFPVIIGVNHQAVLRFEGKILRYGDLLISRFVFKIYVYPAERSSKESSLTASVEVGPLKMKFVAHSMNACSQI
ncbi:unnamed protein product, partial [Meganyctiphanes norvegica]